MSITKISSKSQLTLPKKIREAAGLSPGDAVALEVQNNGIIELRPLGRFDSAFHKALSQTLNEWSTPADEEAFRDL